MKLCEPLCKPSVCNCIKEKEMIEEATIKIKVDGTHTFFTLSGEGIAYEIAEELAELAKNSDMETLTGVNVIKERAH